MPAATSPRKRALMPSGELRRRLRAAGHALSPVVQIGKAGVTDAVGTQVDGALTQHELIKIKIGSECPADRFAVADDMAQVPGAKVAQILGRIILLYRRHPERPRFEPLPGASIEEAPRRSAPRSPRPRVRGGRDR